MIIHTLPFLILLANIYDKMCQLEHAQMCVFYFNSGSLFLKWDDDKNVFTFCFLVVNKSLILPQFGFGDFFSMYMTSYNQR